MLSPFLVLAAVVLFIVGAVLAWPSHIWACLLVGLACWAASTLVGYLPARPPG